MCILRKNRIKRIMSLLMCLFLVLSCFTTVYASEENGNREVKAGIFFFDGYHMKDEGEKLTGYGIDFLHLVSKYSRLNFTYTGYDNSWGDMLDMLEKGEIDVVTSARRASEREQKFAFSRPIGENSTILSARSDDERLQSGDYVTYNGMTVGVLAGSSQNETLAGFAAEKGFSYNAVEFNDAAQLAGALKEKRIDAVLSSNLRKAVDEKTLDTLKTENFYAIVRKGDTQLLEEINYAIEQMDLNEGDWSNRLFYKYYYNKDNSGINFTQRELDYIQKVVSGEKKITMTALGDRMPYSYIEDGKLKGIMPDYFEKLMGLAGLPYEVVVPKDKDDYYNIANTNGVDVVIDRRTSDSTTEGSLYRGFNTEVYMTTGVAKVTRKDFSGEIKKIGIAATQNDAKIGNELIGTAEVLNYPSREEAMQAVIDKEVDAALVFSYAAQMYANRDIKDILFYSIISDVEVDFSMYVRESCDHELVTILNKCIGRMTQEALDQIITKHTSYYALKDITFSQYMRANPMTVVFVLMVFVIILLCMYARSKGKLFAAAEKSNKELGQQLAIVGALSRDYFNVFELNTHKNTARVVKLDGYVPRGLKKGSKDEFPYTSFLNRYINERVHPEERQHLEEALSLEKVEEKLDSCMEYEGSYRILVDGEVHNFQFNYVKIEDDENHKGFTVLVGFRNIDDLVSEEQKRKEELEEALAGAQHANQAKTTFLNSMSHDIRTPMNAIIGFTTLAASHIESRNMVKTYLNKIMTSSRHLLSLINDVLDMSRIESGKVTIEEREESLPEIMHDLKTIAQSEIKARQLSFAIDAMNVTNETIICDRLRLSQVLLNILNNSLKYTKPGGKVSVSVIQTDDAPEGYASYQFRIKDTGIGISKEFQKYMFDPFEREQTATVSGILGSGLGLAITKNIIDMMGGTIEVASEQGQGTEFIVSLSFRTADAFLKTEDVEKLEGMHALIVDDNIDTCTGVSKMLSTIGIRSDWTTQGREAVVRAEFALEQKDPYSVCFVDWMMPDMGGIDVVRSLRRVAGEDVAIIVISAYDWDQIGADAKAAGVTAFCGKPVFLSELCRILCNPKAGLDTEEMKEAEEVPEIFAGRKILLVEDNEMNQEIAREILSDAGFSLDIASDGTEAVEVMKSEKGRTYDLILMDIQMPIMDGYEATRAIRSLDNPECASIPIVALSANAFEEDMQKSFEAGMNKHIAKPIDVSKLLGALEDILKAQG